MILKIMELSMEDKVKSDIENENLELDQRKLPTFSKFLYDNILMQYGLKTIAIKNIVQLCNGIKAINSPYSNYMMRMIGLVGPQLRKDEINIILRCHSFFKEV
jgi:hypothetical protein